MARKAPPPQPPREPVALRVPRAEAAEKIQRQIDEGEELRGNQPRDERILDELREKVHLWSDYNRELLRTLFTTEEISTEYSAYYGGVISMNPSFGEMVQEVLDGLESHLTRLRSIHRRLELYPEPAGVPARRDEPQRGPGSRRIFVVHGHDSGAKETVARFLQKLELDAVILHEQPDAGRTVIEKFEAHAGVVYAVVVLTPDDVGAPASRRTELKPRARQNVILELGYFLGALGRTRVLALRAADVEIPSDLAGVLYVPFDAEGAWKLRVAAELKSAGLPVDLNRAM